MARHLAIKNEHSKAVGQKMRAMGFSDGWNRMEDMPNKWRSLNKQSKQQAIINGLTVSGIAIGAMLTIANRDSSQLQSIN